MADLTSRPSLVLPLVTYRDYFSSANTNIIHGHYVAVLRPYKIYAIDVVASDSLEEIYM